MRNKTLFKIIVIFTFILSLNLVTVMADQTEDIEINNYTTSIKEIYRGDEFNLGITLKNTTEDEINNVVIKILGNSYYTVNTSNIIPVTDKIEAEGYNNVNIPLIYNGFSDTSLGLKIEYEIDGNKRETTYYLTSIAAHPGLDAGDTDIDSENYVPKLILENTDIPQGIENGIINFDLKIKNDSFYNAKEIVIEPQIGSVPLESNEAVLRKSIDILRQGKTTNLNYSFRIVEGAEPQTIPLMFKYFLKNEYGDEFGPFEFKVYVRIVEENNIKNFEIEKVNVEGNRLIAGQDSNIVLSIKNNSIGAKNISISLDDSKKSNFTINDFDNSKEIEEFAIGTSKEVELSIFTDNNVPDGNYPMTIVVKYEDKYGTNYEQKEEVFLKVQSDNDNEAYINIKNLSVPDKEILSNQEFEVSFDVENYGDIDQENVIVSLEGGQFIIPTSQNIVTINKLEAHDLSTITFKLQPLENAPIKSHLLEIKVKTSNGEEIVQYSSIKVGKLSDISIENISVSEKVISAEDEFTIDFDVNNSGLGTAEDLIVLVEGNESLIPLDENVIDIKEIASGEAKHYSIRMEALESVGAQNIPISITVNNSNGTTAVKRFTTVYAEGKSSTKSVPKIIINKFVSTPNIVRAGENFDLDLSFLNTNKAKAVGNIKIYLTVDVESGTNGSGSVFTPVNGSNTFYIDEIKPKQDASISLKMFTIPDAQPKNYTITANMEYEDEDGNQYNSQELIGIQVTQPSKLKIGDINMMSDGFFGQPNPLDIQIYNIGRVSMSNFMVEVEGDFTVQSEDSFIGNLEPGSPGYYYGDLTPNNIGECKGEIVFSYDEPSGEHKEVRKEITMMATEYVQPNYEEMDFNNGMDEFQPPVEEQAGNGKVRLIVILGVVIAALVVGTVVLKRRKKKKEQMDLDE